MKAIFINLMSFEFDLTPTFAKVPVLLKIKNVPITFLTNSSQS